MNKQQPQRRSEKRKKLLTSLLEAHITIFQYNLIPITRMEPYTLNHNQILFNKKNYFLIITLLIYFSQVSSIPIISTRVGCYKSIFGFGDSLTDTGNLLHIKQSQQQQSHACQLPPFGLPPYGETFFHRPTGRCSDGRLIIDFMAEYLGLPKLVPPFFGGKLIGLKDEMVGVNFAVVGASALDAVFLEERLGVVIPDTNISLNIQLELFKAMLPSLCSSPSKCKELLANSVFYLGMGGNDYLHSLIQGINVDEVRKLVPYVVNANVVAIKELIELGAITIMVHGLVPLGCSPGILSEFESSNREDYDLITGCLTWLNKFVEDHNNELQSELNQIRKLNPDVYIIYEDYYNALMRIYNSPSQFGFTGESHRACCGDGGPYNFNQSVMCGYGKTAEKACKDPSKHVNWDGYHFTEATYRLISKFVLQGPYSSPPFNSSCIVGGMYST